MWFFYLPWTKENVVFLTQKATAHEINFVSCIISLQYYLNVSCMNHGLFVWKKPHSLVMLTVPSLLLIFFIKSTLFKRRFSKSLGWYPVLRNNTQFLSHYKKYTQTGDETRIKWSNWGPNIRWHYRSLYGVQKPSPGLPLRWWAWEWRSGHVLEHHVCNA
jgi:hypothetical protein